MRGYNQYKESGKYSLVAGIFRFLLKAGLVAFLCLTAYLWVQRKNIATTLIQHELWKLEIYDLDFRVGELSPFSFELRDVLWGRPDSPFLYLSSVKIHYSPQGLYAGRVDKVAVGRFETQLAFDEQNKPQSELINRVLLAVNRVKQKYPQDQSGAERKPMVMPELTLDRGTLNIAGSEAFPLKGRIDVSTELSQVSNRVDLMGEFVLPQGRTGFKGALDLVSLDINSSLSAKITAGIDVVDLVDPSLGVNMRAVELTGDLFVNGLDGSPEWNLKLQIPSQPCLADNETFSFTSSLMGVGEFAGSVTNVCGNGSFGLAAPVLDIKGAVDRPEISNGCERVYFDFKLPETAFDQMDSSVLVCNAGVSNLNSLAGDLFSLRGGYVESHFNLSVGEGIHFDDSVLDWDDCLVNGLKLLPGELELSVSNEFVCMQTSVSVADEPLKMMFDLAMPLKNPQSGTLKIEMPPAKIDNSGRLGKLIRKKSGHALISVECFRLLLMLTGFIPGQR